MGDEVVHPRLTPEPLRHYCRGITAGSSGMLMHVDVVARLVAWLVAQLPDTFPVTDTILRWPKGMLQAEIDARHIYCIDLKNVAACRCPGKAPDDPAPLFKDKKVGQCCPRFVVHS